MISRRRWIARSLGLGLAMGWLPRAASGEDASLGDAIQRAQEFLAGMVDPELNLLPEFRGSKTYWLYHDNYLVVQTLRDSNPEVAKRVERGIAAFGVDRSGKIEQLFEPTPGKAKFFHHRLDEVTQRGDKIIKTERLTDKAFHGWHEYADLLLLAAIIESQSEPTSAREHFDKAMAMWDGHGLADRVVPNKKLYATYKLALAVLAADRLRVPLPHREELVTRLTGMQNEVGGFITDYNAEGRRIGKANVETTSLALLALRTL